MKYYQIREFETAHPESHDGVVSENELKRRLWEIQRTNATYSVAIEILLHGVKEVEHE